MPRYSKRGCLKLSQQDDECNMIKGLSFIVFVHVVVSSFRCSALLRGGIVVCSGDRE